MSQKNKTHLFPAKAPLHNNQEKTKIFSSFAEDYRKVIKGKAENEEKFVCNTLNDNNNSSDKYKS